LVPRKSSREGRLPHEATAVSPQRVLVPGRTEARHGRVEPKPVALSLSVRRSVP